MLNVCAGEACISAERGEEYITKADLEECTGRGTILSIYFDHDLASGEYRIMMYYLQVT